MQPDPEADRLFEAFHAAADAVARSRPEVRPEDAHEVFHEAATMLHNGLALDGLDEHDAAAVVAGLCADLVAEDPGAAIRTRARKVSDEPGDLHDGEAVAASYEIAAAILQL